MLTLPLCSNSEVRGYKLLHFWAKPAIVLLLCTWLGVAVLAQSADIFPDWEAVRNVAASRYFRAQVSDMHRSKDYANSHPWLAEELLFVQSNARVLVCQNPAGELRYLALPTQVYPVPTSRLGYGPGMYYHFDSVRLYGIGYSLKLEDENNFEPVLRVGDRNETYYGRDFLPVTRTRRGDLDITITSFAPVAADAKEAALAPAPLPGPQGAYYVMRIKNSGASTVRGYVRLAVPAELHEKVPQVTKTRQTLIFSVPDGSVGLRMSSNEWHEEDGVYYAEQVLEIGPGKETLVETVVALGSSQSEILPAVYRFYMHTPLEWLNFTARFMDDRLGQLQVGACDFEEEADISRDIFVRCVLDNFCCLQTDAEGNLVSHYQGVPKEGTIWGIDYEPTIISIARAFPELARQGLLFTLSRSRVPRSEYKDHSVPILVSPVLIARKYLELSGDQALFAEHRDLLPTLEDILEELNQLKAPRNVLYPTRFSSDGPVGRRFDHGTNVKVWYAFDSFAYILEALGESQRASEYRGHADQIRCAIDAEMVVEGPFGRQLSGGTNLGEDPGDFYLPGDIVYYDGEDTSSQLAPIYGIYGFDHIPWMNYHRWARSLFCPSYEPEFGVLRWFPSWNMPVLDGTGFFSILGGSVTRDEMAMGLRNLHRNGCDPTGSVFWWPMGLNFKQGLSRCSQGQGAWAWQYLEQWVGVKADVQEKTLTISPRGLLTEVEWKGLRIGPQRFNLSWREKPERMDVKIENLGSGKWTILIENRPYLTGAETSIGCQSFELSPQESEAVHIASRRNDRSHTSAVDIVKRKEAELLAEDGVVFIRYGTVDPFPDWYELWEEAVLDLRFYLLNATDEDWTKASVTLEYPNGWLAKARRSGEWPKPADLLSRAASINLGKVPAWTSKVVPFQLKGPQDYENDYLTIGKSQHYPSEFGQKLRLPTRNVTEPEKTTFLAKLRASRADGHEIVRELTVPVEILPVSD